MTTALFACPTSQVRNLRPAKSMQLAPGPQIRNKTRPKSQSSPHENLCSLYYVYAAFCWKAPRTGRWTSQLMRPHFGAALQLQASAAAACTPLSPSLPRSVIIICLCLCHPKLCTSCGQIKCCVRIYKFPNTIDPEIFESFIYSTQCIWRT